MTTTSQALSGVEAAKYKQICDKVATLSQAEQEALRKEQAAIVSEAIKSCLLYTSPSPRDRQKSRMPSSA